jgi:hypothetical protein
MNFAKSDFGVALMPQAQCRENRKSVANQAN